MRRLTGLLAITAIMLGGIAGWQHRQIRLLRAELAALDRAKLSSREATETAERPSSAPGILITPAEQVPVDPKPSAELLRLRSQVSQLLGERHLAEAARQEPNGEAAQPHRATGFSVAGMARTNLAFAGYETPEAVLETALYTVLKRDTAGFQHCFSGELLERISRDIERNESTRAADEMGREVDTMENIHVLKREIIDENTAHLTVSIEKTDGKWESEKLLFVREAGQWKLSGSAKSSK